MIGRILLGREFYKGREQAFVKHYVLENYLETFAIKIGMSWGSPTLNYIDGFAGPWQHADEQLQDTSPFIAINKLRKTKAALAEKNRAFNFRCLFIEKQTAPYRKLEAAAAAVNDAEVKARNGEFEDFVVEAAAFAAAGNNPFGFFFIDPTGWTGYGMSKLQPLFGCKHSELLINFMTSFIERFVDSDDHELLSGFQDLFGDKDYRQDWRGLAGLDREDAIVQAYCRRLKQSGNFSFVGSAIVLNPNSDQTCYHLVYATHHPEGMRVFRTIESKAHAQQEELRSEVDRNKRVAKSGQHELFEPNALASRYDSNLVQRYQSKAKAEVERFLREMRRASFDKVEEAALAFPLTSSTTLKGWIREWLSDGHLTLEGLAPKERVPKPNQDHFLIWR